MPKFSIVIPVYNAQKYIKKCISSLMNQTYNDFEIICINDGSTDGSEELLLQLQNEHPQVKIFTQANSGVSSARNRGIIEASGSYILFLDADDYIRNNALSLLNKTINKIVDADIIQFQHINLVNNSIKILSDKYISKVPYRFLENVEKSFPVNDYIFCWDRVYKRDFLLKNNIEFPLKQKFAEDYLFVVQCYKNNPLICTLDNYLYCHVINSDSTCKTNSVLQMFNSICNINLYLKKELSFNNQVYIYSLNCIFYNILRLWNPLFFSEFKKEYLKKVNEYLLELSEYKNLSSVRLVRKYLFINKNMFYWNFVFYIERYLIKFGLKQLILRVRRGFIF